MSEKIKLGQAHPYVDHYSPSLLQVIKRSDSREKIFAKMLPFSGVDIWTSYELSWLDADGKPQVVIAEFTFLCESEFIVESKSLKYYLNSYNQSQYDHWEVVRDNITRDLSTISGSPVTVKFYSCTESYSCEPMTGECIDNVEYNRGEYLPNASLLRIDAEKTECKKKLYTHLFKSNCPVTGQPDWAALWIQYSGKKIDQQSLLAYVVSFRQHQDFHESCVEKIYSDILNYCEPKELSVYARYTRRGGLDINPFRTNCGLAVPFKRTIRQ